MTLSIVALAVLPVVRQLVLRLLGLATPAVGSWSQD
jgi:hypothetical protein